MDVYEWDERYRLSVPEVDEQHKRWFALTNAFLEEVNCKRADNATVKQALLVAVAYAMRHFEDEEQLMRRIRFPKDEFRSHCTMHNAFVERVNALAKRCREGRPKVAEEMAAFMNGWLVRHILQTDVKYVGFYMSLDSVGNRRRLSSRRVGARPPTMPVLDRQRIVTRLRRRR
jgi:hemerythrin-like metal-binding protein